MKKLLSSGAEALIYQKGNLVLKDRVPKTYRIKLLDEKIRKLRTRAEAKIMKKAGKIISVPKIKSSDELKTFIEMDFIDGDKLSLKLDLYSLLKQKKVCFEIGKNIGLLHNKGIIHGDLTTSNMILKENKVYFIDFGLSYQNGKYEDKAVDLHLLRQALEAKHFTNWKELFEQVKKGYLTVNSSEGKKVLERFNAVEKRGRYKH
jgi:TP53 regulating kinase-like protein